MRRLVNDGLVVTVDFFQPRVIFDLGNETAVVEISQDIARAEAGSDEARWLVYISFCYFHPLIV